MLRTALRVLARVAVLTGVVASFGTGCARQAEGERCDYTWAGDQDCDDGLVCTPCGKLQQGVQQFTGRCCLPNGSYTDTRCIPTTSPTEDVCNTHLTSEGTGGTGTGGTGTAGTGTGGTDTAGTGTAGTGGTDGSTAGTTGEGGNGAMSGASGAADGD